VPKGVTIRRWVAPVITECCDSSPRRAVPGVVIFHQHAGQRHLGKSEVIGLLGDRFQAFGPPLARAGLVVLAPDSIAFEGRRPAGEGTDPRDDDWDQHYNELAYRLVVGETLMHKVLQDAMVAVSALSAREDVDSDRLGALGHSYVARSSPAFRGHGATSALAHLRVTGGHALESERFDAIIRWMTKAASVPE
jgi:dienelactone hydrolase